jgi:hypothetical protein
MKFAARYPAFAAAEANRRDLFSLHREGSSNQKKHEHNVSNKEWVIRRGLDRPVPSAYGPAAALSPAVKTSVWTD